MSFSNRIAIKTYGTVQFSAYETDCLDSLSTRLGESQEQHLNTGNICMYHFHNYEEALRINLYEKSKCGKSECLVSDSFEVKPRVAKVYEDYYVRE